MTPKPLLANTTCPIVFDLDRTLLIDDAFELALIRVMRRNPFSYFVHLVRWLRFGWVEFKNGIFEQAGLSTQDLLVDPTVQNLLMEAKDHGREIWIATASPQALAESMALFFGLDPRHALGSSKNNLKGRNKAAALIRLFGRGGFAYVGDSAVDRAIWAESSSAIAVARTTINYQRFSRLKNLELLLDRRETVGGIADWWRLLRPQQWTKNLLVFVPLLTSHQWSNRAAWLASLLAFVLFSGASSAVYLCNDAMDWDSDRQHPKKRHRPVAAGRISPVAAMIFATGATAVTVASAMALSPALAGWVGIYSALALAYTLFIKRVMLVDVVVLSSLYLCRIGAGGQAAEILLSPWLLSFSGFAFFSTAMVKRYCECRQLAATGRRANNSRGYESGDHPILAVLGVSAGMLAGLILSLYVSTAMVAGLYRTPAVLWGLGPVFVVWIGRIWVFAHRGLDVQDPIDYAMRDRGSYGVLLIAILICASAL